MLSFLLASLDSLLRDMTHWLPANTHSSWYDNHFDPSFRRSTPSKGIKERANASIRNSEALHYMHETTHENLLNFLHDDVNAS